MPMKNVLKLFILTVCSICVSCGTNQKQNEQSPGSNLISLLEHFNNELKTKNNISKDEFTDLVKYYKELEDSMAVVMVRDSLTTDIHTFTHISISQSQIASRLCRMADSCNWTFADIPVFQEKIYSYSHDKQSTPFHEQAVIFFEHLKTEETYIFKTWKILFRDYNGFLSKWAKAQINDLSDFYQFLNEENRLFTAFVTNCSKAGQQDMSTIINGTNTVCQRLMTELTASGIPSLQVRTFMLVRSNHRLIKNATCGLETLSKSNLLPKEHFDLYASLLLSPFICVNRQLVCIRTKNQTEELIRIGKDAPIVLDKYCSHYGIKDIYFNDMPLSIIKKIITDDID